MCSNLWFGVSMWLVCVCWGLNLSTGGVWREVVLPRFEGNEVFAADEKSGERVVVQDGLTEPDIAIALARSGAVANDGFEYSGVNPTSANIVAEFSKGSFTTVILAQINRTMSNDFAVLMMLTKDGKIKRDIEVTMKNSSIEETIRHLEDDVVLSLHLGLIFNVSSQVLYVVSGAFESKFLRFHVSQLADEKWHIVAVVGDSQVAGAFGVVSVHIDGQDPYVNHLFACERRTRVLLTENTPQGGSLGFGPFEGSVFGAMFFDSALTPQAIAVVGTRLTRESAAGMTEKQLLYFGVVLLAIAGVLLVWTIIHTLNRKRDLAVPMHTSHDSNPLMSAHHGDTSDGLDAMASKGGESMVSASATAQATLTNMQSATMISSASSVVDIAAITLQVPQGLSAVMPFIAFPQLFLKVFGSLFDMMTIDFSFPDISVPSYAPLVVILIGAVVCGLLLCYYGWMDRENFNDSIHRSCVERAAYEMLVAAVFQERAESGALSVADDAVVELSSIVGSWFPLPPSQQLLFDRVDRIQSKTSHQDIQNACARHLDSIPQSAMESIVRRFAVEERLHVPRKLEASVADQLLSFSNFLSTSDASNDELLAQKFIMSVFQSVTFISCAQAQAFEDLVVGFVEHFVSPSREEAIIEPMEEMKQRSRVRFTRRKSSFAAVVSTRTHHEKLFFALDFIRKATKRSKLNPPHHGGAPSRSYAVEAPGISELPCLKNGTSIPAANVAACFMQWEAFHENQPSHFPLRHFDAANHVSRVADFRAKPTTSLKCCPSHAKSLVPATESHHEMTTLDGRKLFRCCNEHLDLLKLILHRDKDECDDSDLFVCSDQSCSFAVCGVCVKRELGPIDRIQTHVAGLVYEVSQLDQPILPVLALVALQALLFPITKVPLLVMTCNPLLVCWIGDCVWSDSFSASFGVAVILLAMRVSIAIGFFVELTWRRRIFKESLREKLSGVIGNSKMNVENASWKRFLEVCDVSLLSAMYRGVDLHSIAVDPVLKLAVDLGVVSSVVFTKPNSIQQRLSVACVYVLQGITLNVLNPKLDMTLNVLSKAVVIHQLVAVGLSSINLSLSIDADSSLASDVVIAIMLTMTSGFFAYVLFVLGTEIAYPLLLHLRRRSARVLIRREEKLAHSGSTKQTKLMQILKEKEDLFGKNNLQVNISRALLCRQHSRLRDVVISWIQQHSSHSQSFLSSERGSEVGLGYNDYLLAEYAVQAFGEAILSLSGSRRRRLTTSLSRLLGEWRCNAAVNFAASNTLMILAYCGVTQRLDLRNSMLSRSRLCFTRFSNCSFEGANLRDADLRQTVFVQCNLSKSNFDDAVLGAKLDTFIECRCSGEITCFTFSLDGVQLCCGDSCGNVVFFDAATGYERSSKKVSECAIRSVAFSHEGTFAGSEDCNVYWWSTDGSLSQQLPHRNAVVSLSTSVDFTIACCCCDTVVVWSYGRNHNSIFRLFTIDFDAQCAAFSVDGLHLWCAGKQGLRCYNIRGDVVWSWQDQLELNCLAVSLDGKRVACSCLSVSSWFVIEYNGAVFTRVIEGHTDGVSGLAYSPNGSFVMTCSRDNSIRLWDSVTHKEQRRIQTTEPVTSVCFSIEGGRFASATNKIARIWNANVSSELSVPTGHSSYVSCVAYTSDGHRLISCGGDKSIRVWDTSNLLELHRLEGHNGPVFQVCVSQDGNSLVSCSEDRTVRLWQLRTGRQVYRVLFEEPVDSVCFSPNSMFVACGLRTNAVVVWQTSKRRLRQTFEGHRAKVVSVVFCEVYGHLYSGSKDRSVRRWDTSTAQSEVLIHDSEVSQIALTSAWKRRVLTACDDGNVYMWNAKTLQLEQRVSASNRPLRSLSCCAYRLVCAGDGGSMTLWDIGEHCVSEIRSYSGFRGSVHSVSFSSDASKIATGGDDKTVRIWSAKSHSDTMITIGDTTVVCDGHDGAVTCTAVDGELIVTGGDDGFVRLWNGSRHDIETSWCSHEEQLGKSILAMKLHRIGISSIAMSSNDDIVVVISGDEDGIIVVWQLKIKYMKATDWDPKLTDDKIGFAHESDGLKQFECVSQRELRGHRLRINGIVLRGQTGITVSDDRSLRCWNIHSGLCLVTRYCDAGISAITSIWDSHIAVGCGDGSVVVWAGEDFTPTVSQNCVDNRIVSLLFQLSQSQLLSCCENGTITTWHVTLPSGEATMTLSAIATRKVPNPLRCCALTSSEYILTAGEPFRNSLLLWDAKLKRPLTSLEGHEEPILAIASFPRRSIVVTGSKDESMRIWVLPNTDDLECEVAALGLDNSDESCVLFEGHMLEVTCTAISPSSKLFASGSNDKTVRLWNAISQNELFVLEGHQNASKVSAVVFCSEDALASGGDDGVVCFWSTDTGVLIRKFDAHGSGVQINAAVVRGKLIATCGENKIKIWDQGTGENEISSVEIDSSLIVRFIVFSVDEKFLVSASSDGIVRVYTSDLGALRYALHHGEGLAGIAFSHSNTFLVSYGSDGNLILWNAVAFTVARKRKTQAATCAAFTRDDRYCVIGGGSRLSLWDSDFRCHEPLSCIDGHDGNITSLTCAPTRNWIVSSSSDETVRVWRMTHYAPTSSLPVVNVGGEARIGPATSALGSGITCIALAEHGRRFVTAKEDGSIQLFEDDQSELLTYYHSRNSSPVRTVAISPDMTLVLSGSYDGYLWVFDACRGIPVASFAVGDPVACVVFSSCRTAVSASGSRLRMWNVSKWENAQMSFIDSNPALSSEQCLLKVSAANLIDGVITAVEFNGSGDRLCSGGDDRIVRVWSAKTLHILNEMHGHRGCVRSVCFSPDSSLVGSCGDDRYLCVFRSDTSASKPLRKARGHLDRVEKVCFSHDGSTLVSCGRDGTIRLWTASLDDYRAWLLVGPDNISHMTVNTARSCIHYLCGERALPKSSTEEEGSWSMRDLAWPSAPMQPPNPVDEITDKHNFVVMDGHDASVSALTLFDSLSVVVTGDTDGFICIWSLVTFKRVGSMSHDTEISALFAADNESILVSCDTQCNAILWRAEATGGAWVQSGTMETLDPVRCIAQANHGTVIGGCDDGSLRLWSTTRKRLTFSMRGHQGSVLGLSCSPMVAEIVASCGDDGSIHVWTVCDEDRSIELKCTLRGHAGGTTGIAFCRDGLHLVSVGKTDFCVSLWDLVDCALVRRRPMRHKDTITSVCVSRDGTCVLTSSRDGAILMWDDEISLDPVPLVGHRGPVNCVSITDDSQWIVSCGVDETVRAWAMPQTLTLTTSLILTRSGTEKLLIGHAKPVSCIALSQSESRIASGSADTTVRVWDCNTSSEVFICEALSAVRCVAFSPDDKQVICGTENGDLWAWSAMDGTVTSHINCLAKIFGLSVKFDGDNHNAPLLAATALDHYVVRIWDLAKKTCVAQFRHEVGDVNAVVFSADGRHLATCGADKTVRLWHTTTYESVAVFSCHREAVRCVAFSPDGSRLVSCSDDCTIALYDVPNASILMRRRCHLDSIVSCCFSRDGRFIISGSKDRTVRICDAGLEFEPKVQETNQTLVYAVAACSESSYGQHSLTVIAGCGDDLIRWWSIDERQLEISTRSQFPDDTLSAGGPDTTCITNFTVDEQHERVLTASEDGVRVWSLKIRNEILCFTQPDQSTSAFTCVCGTSDGRLVAAGDSAKHITLWNATRGVLIEHKKAHDGVITAIQFSPNNSELITTLASSSQDRSLRVWMVVDNPQQVANEEPPSRLRLLGVGMHDSAVTCMLYTSTGAHLVTGSVDASIRMWNSSHFSDGVVVQPMHILREHRDAIRCIAVSADSLRMVSGGDDRKLCLWNFADGGLIKSRNNHRNSVTTLDYSADGRWICSGSEDFTILLWNSDLTTKPKTLYEPKANESIGPIRQVMFQQSKNSILFTGRQDNCIRSLTLNPEFLTRRRHEDTELCSVVLQAHDGACTCLAVSHDQLLLASGGSDKFIHLWDTRLWRKTCTLAGHDGTVRCIAFFPDDLRVASCGGDSEIIVWSTQRVASILTMTKMRFHNSGGYNSVAVSPRGNFLITGAEDCNVRVWSVMSRETEIVLSHRARVMSVAYARQNNELFASGSADFTIQVWRSIPLGELVFTLRGHNDVIRSLSFSVAGLMLASAAEDGTLCVWDLVVGSIIRRRSTINGKIKSLSFCDDEGTLVTGDGTGAVTLWRDNGTSVEQQLQGHEYSVEGVCAPPGAKWFASCSEDETVRIWAYPSKASPTTAKHAAGALPTIPPLQFAVVGGNSASACNVVAASDDGRRVVAGSEDGKVRLWDTADGSEILCFAVHEGAVYAVAITSDGNRIVSAGVDRLLRLLDGRRGTLIRVFEGHTQPVRSLAFSKEGTRVVSGSDDKTIRLWEVMKQNRVGLGRHYDSVTTVSYANHGRYIASGGADHLILIWSSDSLTQMRLLKGHKGGVSSLCFLSSSTLLSVGLDSAVCLWDADSGALLRRRTKKYESGVASCCCTSDGKFAITCGVDGSLLLWDGHLMIDPVEVGGRQDSASCCCVFPSGGSSGDSLLSCGSDGCVHLWPLATDKVSQQLQIKRDMRGGDLNRCLTSMDGIVHAVAASADGKRVCSAGDDGVVRVWDVELGNELMSLENPDHTAVLAVSLSVDGQRILTGDKNGHIGMWNLATDHKKPEMFWENSPQKFALHSVAFSLLPGCEQNIIACGADDGAVCMWDCRDTSAMLCCGFHQGPVWQVRFSSDGARLVSCSSDQHVAVWDVSHPQTIRQLYLLACHRDTIRSAVFSPDGQKIVSCGDDGYVCLWDISSASGGYLLVRREFEKAVMDCSFTEDGTLIVCGGKEQSVVFWTSSLDATRVATLRGHLGGIRSLCPLGLKFVASGAEDGTVRIWPMPASQLTPTTTDADDSSEWVALTGHAAAINCVVISTDGRLAASVSADNTLRLWDLERRTPKFTKKHWHSSNLFCVAFSHDNRQIATGGDDNMIYLWDVSQASLDLKIPISSVDKRRLSPSAYKLSRLHINALQFSRDGKFLVSGTSEGSMQVWDMHRRGRHIITGDHDDEVLCVCVSPSSLEIASGGRDQAIRRWSLKKDDRVLSFDQLAESQVPMPSLRAHRGAVLSAGYSATGSRLVSSGEDRSVCIWDVQEAQGKLLRRLRGHPEVVTSVSFSGNGAWLVSSCEDKLLRLWNAGAIAKPITLSGHEASVLSASIDDRGTFMVSGDSSGKILLWLVDKAVVTQQDFGRSKELLRSPAYDGKTTAQIQRPYVERNSSPGGSPHVSKAGSPHNTLNRTQVMLGASGLGRSRRDDDDDEDTDEDTASVGGVNKSIHESMTRIRLQW